MNLDIKKHVKASLLFIALGVILVIISMILQLLSLIITDSNGEIVQLITLGYKFLMIPVFLIIYFFAGINAVKRHKLDAVGAGIVSAFAYVVTAVAHLFFGFLLNMLVVSGLIPAGAGFGSPEAILAAQLFGDMVGGMGIGISVICGFGIIATGAMINFVIGGFGGLFAQR